MTDIFNNINNQSNFSTMEEITDRQFVLDENVREMFPVELDFLSIPGEGIENKREALKFIGRKFTATFPETEFATRIMTAAEKAEKRSEYCGLVEDILPELKVIITDGGTETLLPLDSFGSIVEEGGENP